MRESAIEEKVCRWATRNGWLVRKFKSSKRGVPDRVFIRNGIVVFIEFKRKGGVPTPQQANEHAALRAAGAVVYVFDDVEKGIEILQGYF